MVNNSIPTRLLMISPNGFLGGAERFVLETAKEHLRLKNIFIFVLFLNDGQCFRLCKDEKIPCELVPFKVRLSRPWSVIKLIIYLHQLNKINNFNIIHSTMPYSQILAAIYGFFNPSTKLVWYQHGPVGGLLDKFAIFTRVDKIFFNSKYLQNVHNSFSPAKRSLSKQVILPYGIANFAEKNNEEISNIIKRHHLENKKIFIIPGRICDWKGHKTLLNVLIKLKSTHNKLIEDCRFLLIGSANSNKDKEFEFELNKIITENSLDEYIISIGHTINIHPYYQMAHALIHLSTIPEPFGLVVAEAMKSNCFVIGSNVGGITDILKNGETGLSFSSTTINAEKELIEKLIEFLDLLKNDKPSLDLIVSNAKKLIEENYNLENETILLEKYYTEILK